MPGLDTNVVVRWILDDDPPQVTRAANPVFAADAELPFGNERQLVVRLTAQLRENPTGNSNPAL